MGETLSDRLKRLRSERGLSVKEVAEKIGVPVTTYREWEHGRKIVGEPYVALAKLFGIGVHELITGEKVTNQEVERGFERIETELRKLKETLLSM